MGGTRARLGGVGSALVAVAVLLSACGGKSHAAGGGGGSGVLLSTRSAGSVGTVLADSTGRTLYHLTTETNGRIQCTGGCASVWPPLLAGGATVPATVAGLPGQVGTVHRPDGGVQVSYDGMPLYRYSGDSAPGQANGQGIQGVWFALIPTGGAASSSPSSASRGYGY